MINLEFEACCSCRIGKCLNGTDVLEASAIEDHFRDALLLGEFRQASRGRLCALARSLRLFSAEETAANVTPLSSLMICAVMRVFDL